MVGPHTDESSKLAPNPPSRPGALGERIGIGPFFREAGGSAGSPLPSCPGRWRAVRRFLGATRAGATTIASVAAGVMAIGGAALITDHLWLINQRDLLKEAAAAGAMAATIEFRRYASSEEDLGKSASCEEGGEDPPGTDPAAETPSASEPSTNPVLAKLEAIAIRYVRMNLIGNLPAKDRERASDTLCVEVVSDPESGTVDVTATAELGGPLFSPDFRCMVGQFTGVFGGDGGSGECGAETSLRMRGSAGAERATTVTEVILAIDMSNSMKFCIDKQPGGYFSDCPNEWRGRTKDDSRMEIVKEAAKVLVDILAPDAADPTVAIGLVPWEGTVRLDEASASRWVSEGWAVYPQEKVYPLPYSLSWDAGPYGASVTRTLPAEPSEDENPWLGCLDRRSVEGASPPGHSVATPADAPFPKAFYPHMAVDWGVELNAADVPNNAYSPFYYIGNDSSGRLPSQINCAFCDDGGSVECAGRADPRIYAELPPMIPLTSNRQELSEALDDLAFLHAVGGSTHSALGVVWAHRMLTHSWKDVWGTPDHPIDPTDPLFNEARRAIVLLTDGIDSYEDKGLDAWGRDPVCQAAKDAGIRIYVIAAMPPERIDQGLADGLRDCSSEADDPSQRYVFINNTSRADLEEAFRTIAEQILVVRRTH